MFCVFFVQQIFFDELYNFAITLYLILPNCNNVDNFIYLCEKEKNKMPTTKTCHTLFDNKKNSFYLFLMKRTSNQNTAYI